MEREQMERERERERERHIREQRGGRSREQRMAARQNFWG